MIHNHPIKIPSIQDLEIAYQNFFKIQLKQLENLPLQTLIQYCQWVRFDSRLGEICAHYFTTHWEQLNPIHLNQTFKKSHWPSILGVLLEFSKIEFFLNQDSIQIQKRHLFHCWHQTAICDLPTAHWEQFFIGKRRIAGQAMWDDVRLSLEEYKKWGYFSREVLIHNAHTQNLGSYSIQTRIEILNDFLQHQDRLTTNEYWIALKKRASIRQAERDLLSCRKLRSVGKTKSRYFIKK